MGDRPTAQRRPPHPAEATPTVIQAAEIIRAPALRVDTPDNPIRDATLSTQADQGVILSKEVTPSSQDTQLGAIKLEVTQHGVEVTNMEQVMEVDT